MPSIEAAKETYRSLYGATDITETKPMEEQGVNVAFVNLANSQIELLEPLNDKSPIHNFLQRNPNGGQHHVCFEVKNIYEARDDMVKKGATVLGEPRIGAHGTLIVFVHPKNTHGVLIELMEEPKH